MDSLNEMNERLQELGFDPNKDYDAPGTLEEASLQSIERFIGSTAHKEPRRSRGLFHITGPSVSGNTAPVKSVGNFLTSFQGIIDSIGASLKGNKTASGQLSADITGRTEISMVASPLPGSVIIQIEPTMCPENDLYPDGRGLFDLEEMGIKPLADLAIDEFISLVTDIDPKSADSSKFVDHLSDLGPRVASSVKAFYESIDKGSMDIEIKWKDSNNRKSVVANVSHIFAHHAVNVINEANIENEIITVQGVLKTVTYSEKDKLRIETEDGSEKTISIGSIAPSSLLQLFPGEYVCIETERRISHKPGGGQKEKLIGLSISQLQAIE